MNFATKPFALLLAVCVTSLLLYSCGDIIEPSIAKKNVQAEAPADKYQSSSYAVNFWWDPVDNALKYHLQVVTPKFDSVSALVLDTIIASNKFTYSFSPGKYQWRVLAQNGSSQTPYTSPRTFMLLPSSIKQQQLQVSAPANNLVTNQSSLTFSWNSLYGATTYRLEIDTNNFENEAAVVYNQATPTLQQTVTLSKDQAYQWRVRAENDTAQSQWSSVYYFTFDHTPPAQVTLVSPTNAQTVTQPVLLQWNPSSSAVKYKLYLYKSDAATLYNSSFPMTVTATSYSFNAGTSGDKIYWKVTAVDAAGNESTATASNYFQIQ